RQRGGLHASGRRAHAGTGDGRRPRCGRRGHRRRHRGRRPVDPSPQAAERFRPDLRDVHVPRGGRDGRDAGAGEVTVDNFAWLSALWLTPLVGAGVVACLPTRGRDAARWVAFAFSLVVLGLAVVVAVGFEPGGDRFQFVESHSWIPAFGTRYELGLDGIA